MGISAFLMILGTLGGQSAAAQEGVVASDTGGLSPAETTGGNAEALDVVRRRGLLGLIGPRLGLSRAGAPDTTEIPVSSRVAQEIRWEVARRWSVDPDRVHLRFGAVSAPSPERVQAVRVLGTGSGGYWIALLAPADATETPVRVRVRAGVERPVPVATREIVRGTVLTAQDIALETAVGWGGTAEEGVRVQPGWVARRLLRAGEVLKGPAVTAPNAVESGEEVEVVWKRGAVAVSVKGVALGTGPIGSVVRVRTDNGRQLRGVARGPGLVVVGECVKRGC